MSIKLQLARQYLKNGWSVFPIPVGKKKPVIEWGEYQTHYATDEQLIEWFKDGQNDIGIATGKLSGITVLDADGITGVQELVRLGLTSPVTVLTGGGGKHLYFKHTGETNKRTSKDHQGLDSRGEGGYVVAAGSSHASGMKYRWACGVVPSALALPTWPTGLLEKKYEAPVCGLPNAEPGLIDALKGAGSGDRHRFLVKIACYLIPRHSYELTKAMLIDWNEKNTPPLADEEVVKQLDDLVKRFKSGQYKTKYQPPKQEMHNEPPKESTLDICTTTAAETYFDEQLAAVPAPIPELSTGFNCLDKATWGIKRGNLYVVGARPGIGKTTYAVNVAAQLCRANKRVLFFSTEMSPKELYDKFAASEGSIPASNISTRTFTPSDRTKLKIFIPQFKAYDLHIVNLFRPDKAAVKEAVDRIKPDVLIFDHIQHIKEGTSEYSSISEFTRFLKELARDYNLGVVVNSQLSRSSTFESVIPELQHLKGCGTIEEEASVVILLHDTTNKGDRPVLFRVAKNRFGKCGDTTLMFKEDNTKFESMGNEVS